MKNCFLAISVLLTSALGFEVIPDTLNVLNKSIIYSDSLLFISNQSDDTLKIDSMYVSKFHTNSDSLEAHIGIRGSLISNSVWSFYVAFYSKSNVKGFWTKSDSTRIPPHTQVYVERARIDYCIDFCPAPPMSAKVLTGDTVSITMVFVSGTQKDSLTIIGLESKASSSSIFPKKFTRSFGNTMKPSWNVLGRILDHQESESPYFENMVIY